MPDEFANDAEAVGLDVMLHEAGDVAPSGVRLHVLDGHVERSLGYVQELLFLRGDMSDGDGDGGIAAVALVSDGDVEGDDVAFLELARARDSENDDFVDADAGESGETF